MYPAQSNGLNRNTLPLTHADQNGNALSGTIPSNQALILVKKRHKGPQAAEPLRISSGETSTTPIVTNEKCEIPEALKRELHKCKTHSEKVEVIRNELEKQKLEVTHLAEMHRQLNLIERSKELERMVDQSAYAIAVFNRRQKLGRLVPYYFQLMNMPQPNVNLDMPPDVIEVTDLRAVNYAVPVDCGSGLETYVELEFTNTSSGKYQKLKTSWMPYVDGLQYQPLPIRFSSGLTSEQYAHQIKATVYYNRGTTRKPGVFGWVYISISDLVHSANVVLTENLNAGNGVMPGYLKFHLRQRTPLKGPYFLNKRKPWLFLDVDDISRVTNSPVVENGFRNPDPNTPHLRVKYAGTHEDLERKIIEQLRGGLNYNPIARKTLSTLNQDMIQLHQMDITDKSRSVSSYCAELNELQSRYKSKRKESEALGQIKQFKYYLKRELLIKQALARYNQGQRLTRVSWNSTNRINMPEERGSTRISKHEEILINDEEDDLEMGASASPIRNGEPFIVNVGRKQSVTNHDFQDKPKSILIHDR